MSPEPPHQPIDHHVRDLSKPPLLEKFFAALSKQNGSDLHLKADCPPHMRKDAVLRPTTSPPLSNEKIEEMVADLMSEDQRAFFAEKGAIDLAHEVPGGDRFRINIFRQRGAVSVAVRRVTRDIPDFDTLHLPAAVKQVAEAHQGLILLAGPTGCGKSTTIASMLEYINKTRNCHIVTIEDPIEYLYDDKKALVNQREIGIDVESFEAALKYLMREDPDVVLIGEMRDFETFQAALQASETGHLVFGTIHASGASQAIGRILDLFPHEARGRVRQSLASNMRAIIAQKLLPGIKKEIPRVPAVEILINGPSVHKMIEDEQDGELPELIRANEDRGMLSFTKSLLLLMEKDLIDPHTAYDAAPNVDELKMRMKGITTSQSGLIGGR